MEPSKTAPGQSDLRFFAIAISDFVRKVLPEAVSEGRRLVELSHRTGHAALALRNILRGHALPHVRTLDRILELGDGRGLDEEIRQIRFLHAKERALRGMEKYRKRMATIANR